MAYYQQNVLAQLKTDPDNLALASTTNAIVTSSTITILASTTQPASSGRGASQWIVTDRLNYLKIIPFIQNTGGNTVTNPSLRVIGWNQNVSTGLWIPVTLCDLTITLHATDTTINSVSMRQARVFTKNQGDAKLFNSDSTHLSGAGFIVDTIGCQFMEIAYRATSVTGSPAATSFYASL